MSEIFKKLLLKKETPFLLKIVNFRHKIAWISEKKAHSQKPQDTCLIICHKEVPPAVLAKSRIRTPDHLLVSTDCCFRAAALFYNFCCCSPDAFILYICITNAFSFMNIIGKVRFSYKINFICNEFYLSYKYITLLYINIYTVCTHLNTKILTNMLHTKL